MKEFSRNFLFGSFRQIMCVLDKAPCDNLGKQLKAALPEVIVRNCKNCTKQQAQNAQKLISFLQTRYPDVWAMLVRKYKVTSP